MYPPSRIGKVVVRQRPLVEGGSTIIVYQMGRLCGEAHEISGIKTPLFLFGGWLEGSWGGWW